MKVSVSTLWPLDYDGLRVVQTNSRPSARPQEILVDDCGSGISMIRIWVPTRMAGVETQTDTSAWKTLVDSYAEVMCHIGVSGYGKVCMPALGTSLYWPTRMTASAAKEAMQSAVGLRHDLELMFVVLKEDVDTWLDELRCFDAHPAQ